MQFIETMVSILSCSSVVMEGLKPIPAVKERQGTPNHQSAA